MPGTGAYSDSIKDHFMPIGDFLDAFPSALFIVAHLVFLGVGLWAVKKAMAANLAYAPAFWLYVASQIGFLVFFGGLFTLKLAVLIEQTLLVILVIWVITKASGNTQS
jgi:hypothetical protein